MLNSDELLSAIGRGAASDADAASKRAAAQACRWLLTALESEPGAPLVPPDPPAAPTEAPPPAVHSVAAPAAPGIPATQLLDLVIARLKAELPSDAPEPERPAIRIPFVPVPTGGGR